MKVWDLEMLTVKFERVTDAENVDFVVRRVKPTSVVAVSSHWSRPPSALNALYEPWWIWRP
jgi:hypothetical protein